MSVELLEFVRRYGRICLVVSRIHNKLRYPLWRGGRDCRDYWVLIRTIEMDARFESGKLFQDELGGWEVKDIGVGRSLVVIGV